MKSNGSRTRRPQNSSRSEGAHTSRRVSGETLDIRKSGVKWLGNPKASKETHTSCSALSADHKTLLSLGYSLVHTSEDDHQWYTRRVPRRGRFYRFEVTLTPKRQTRLRAWVLSPDTNGFEAIDDRLAGPSSLAAEVKSFEQRFV